MIGMGFLPRKLLVGASLLTHLKGFHAACKALFSGSPTA